MTTQEAFEKLGAWAASNNRRAWEVGFHNPGFLVILYLPGVDGARLSGSGKTFAEAVENAMKEWGE